MARNPIGANFAAAILLLASALSGAARAQSTLPTNGHVVAGSATIGAPAGATLQVNQTSNRAVIDWNSFSVGQPNTVVFIQPGSSAAVLNRVTGLAPSTIAGQVRANGQVYLVNPNGIAITASGSVQVGGGFVASTLGIATDDFMRGDLAFSGAGASAGVSNAGNITVGAGGYVALIGGAAANSGLIAAPLGKVALGAGEQATLDPSGDGFLQIALPTGATTADGQALVSNSGRVDAAGGVVELRAATAATAIRNTVNMSGVVAANSVSGHDGAIVLDGGPGGGVVVSGAIDAAGRGAGESGGAIKITGGSVALAATATLDASGEAGGGRVEVGGGPHGADPGLANATTTYVAGGATIDASATGNGNGGTVSVWSNGTTVFNGAIRATGGPGGGDGGWVETSGEGVLNVGPSATVSATAPRGTAGSWLLDPNSNVDITNATANATCVEADALTCIPTADSSTIDAGAITSGVDGLGAGNNVIILTTCGGGNTCSGAQAGSITVDAAINWTTSTSLTLTAAGGITINQPISGTNSASSVNLTAGGAIAEEGAGTIQTGTLTTSSAGGTTLGAANQVGAFDATNTGSGFILLDDAVPTLLVNGVSNPGGGGLGLNINGNVVLNGTIDVGAGTVAMGSSGSITDAGATDVIIAGVLSGGGATGVTLSDPNQVGTLDNFVNSASGNFDFANGKSLTVSGAIDGLAPGGTLTLSVSNGGALTVNGLSIVQTIHGAITLIADSMTFGGQVSAGSAPVTLEPFTAGRAIDIGTTPAGVLGLTQASLNEVTANALRIGSPTAGDETITAPITAPASWGVLTLINNGTISQQAGDSLSVQSVRTSSTGPVTLDVASNAIGVFAANATSSVSLVSGINLVVGTVDGVNGVTSATGDVSLTSSGEIVEVGAPISTPGTLTTSSATGTLLANANVISQFSATNTGSGAITLTDTTASLLIDHVSQSGSGGVTITNSGDLAVNGALSDAAGTVTLTSTGGALNDTGVHVITANVLTGGSATGTTLSSANLIGTLGPFTNTTSGNVFIGNAQSLATSGTVSNLAPGGTLELIVFNGGALKIGGNVTTANGAITLSADGMNLASPVNAGTARVTLTPATAGVPIDLGIGGAGLSLNPVGLVLITAGVLQIGGPTAGALTISAPISAPAGWNVLTLVNNGAISQPGGAGVAVPDLRVSSSGPVTLDAINNIQTFAASSSSGVSLVDLASLTIGTVDGVSGVSTNASQIQIATKGGPIAIDGAVASGGGEIDIAAAPGFGITNTTTSIASGGGNIVLLGDTLALAGGTGSVNAGGGTLVLAPATTSDNVLLGAPSVAGGLGLQNADFSTLTAGQLQIGYRNENGTSAGAFGGSILVESPVGFTFAQTPSVLLVTGVTGVVQEQPAASLSFGAAGVGTLGIIAGEFADLASGSPNQAATLAGFTDFGPGATFAYRNTGPLIVGALPSPTLGVAVAASGLASSAAMATGAGLPTSPLAGITTNNAAVQLTADGSLVLNGNIAAGSGAVMLRSTGGSISDAGASDIITASILTGSAATGVVLSSPSLVNTLGPFTNTTSGNVFIANGQSLSTSGTISNAAPGGSLELSISNGGALTTGGNVTTSNGIITLTADNTMTFNSPVSAGTARVVLTPSTAGVAINLAGNPGGVLGLTQASLSQVTAGVLQIGAPTAGSLTVTGSISAPAGWNTLTLVNNGAVSELVGAPLTVANLRVSSAGTVTLNTLGNNIQTFAASSSSSSSIVDQASLTIGTVDGVTGIATSNGAPVNVTSSGSIGESGGGFISTTGTLTTSAAGGVTLGGANTVGAFNVTNNNITGNILLTNTATSLTITGVSQGGNNSVTLSNSGDLVLNGSINNVFGAVTLNAGGPITQAAGAPVSSFSLSGSSVGGATLASSNSLLTFGGWTDTGAGSAGLIFKDTETLAVAGAVSSASGPVVLATTAGNLTLMAGSTVTGNGVVLAAPGSFINQAGAGAVIASGGSRWLIYGTQPSFDTFDGLNSGNTAIWNSTFSSLPPLSVTLPGDRYIFFQGQTLTVTTTNVSKVYGQDATASVASAFTLSGFASGVAGAFLGDTAATAAAGAPSVTSLGSPTTASVAGAPYTITASAGSLTSPDGYAVAFANTGALSVSPAPLTASIIGAPTKVYDGTANASLVSGNFALSGFVAGQGATVSPLTGAYNSANVVSATTVTATLTAGEFTATGGAVLSNYSLPTAASGAGAITPAGLTASIIGNPTKVYDATATATLVSGNFALAGFVAGQGATVAPLTGAYNSPNVASATTVTAALTAGEFTPTGGASFSNYTLPTTASGAGAITPATLTASIIGNPTKVYDGGAAAALGSSNFALSGFVAGQGATVSPLTGSYATANAGAGIGVSANLVAGEFTATGGALLSNYALPTAAAGTGAITPAPLAASIVGNPTKVYDGTASAALVSSNFALVGFVAGQGATVSPLTGAYNSANVASATTVGAALTAGEFTANAGTSFSNYTLPSTASGAGAITPAGLTASIVGTPSKVYDGTATAALTSSNFALSGFVAGQGATVSPLTGAYNSANVASATTVTAALTPAEFTANGGALLSNYTLPATASGAGAITPRPITVTADNLLRLEDEPNPPLTFTVTGNLVGGDSLGGALATTANISSPAGSYPITQGTLAATQNYSLSFVDGALVVTAADFGVSPDTFIPPVLGLAVPETGPTPCSSDDLAAILRRAGAVVVFGPQGSAEPSGAGGGCSGASQSSGLLGSARGEEFGAAAVRTPEARVVAAQAFRPLAKRPRPARMAAAS